MKIISYSLFKGSDPLAEIFYVRGLYFNALMNSLVYPDWKTVVHVDAYIYSKYQALFENLYKSSDLRFVLCDPCHTHCQKMLWRMLPIFDEQVEYVICRDADALTGEREAKAVSDWVESGLILHGINDNPAHSIPLLGGMCGFKAEPVRQLFDSWDNMLSKSLRPIDKHGSDQVFLNSVLLQAFPGQLALYLGRGTESELKGEQTLLMPAKKAASDLCTSFIGAAGCNEMETLRFFRDHLPGWGSDMVLWEAYPKLFYWL